VDTSDHLMQRAGHSTSLTRRLVEAGAFDDDPFVLADVGAAGGIAGHWRAFEPRLTVVAFEAQTAAAVDLDPSYIVVPQALGAAVGVGRFRQTRFGPASGLHNLSPFFRRLEAARDVETVAELEIRVSDFDSLARASNWPAPDFFKLDVQGAELEVLQGATEALTSGSVLGVELETWLVRPGPTVPLFPEIDTYLRPFGFEIFDLDLYRYPRRGSGVQPLYDLPGGVGPGASGQVVWADVLYLLDPVGAGTRLPDADLHKLACLFDLYGLSDCAFELARAFNLREVEAHLVGR
jgi:FkbM family methyltransferase